MMDENGVQIRLRRRQGVRLQVLTIDPVIDNVVEGVNRGIARKSGDQPRSSTGRGGKAPRQRRAASPGVARSSRR